MKESLLGNISILFTELALYFILSFFFLHTPTHTQALHIHICYCIQEKKNVQISFPFFYP